MRRDGTQGDLRDTRCQLSGLIRRHEPTQVVRKRRLLEEYVGGDDRLAGVEVLHARVPRVQREEQAAADHALVTRLDRVRDAADRPRDVRDVGRIDWIEFQCRGVEHPQLARYLRCVGRRQAGEIYPLVLEELHNRIPHQGRICSQILVRIVVERRPHAEATAVAPEVPAVLGRADLAGIIWEPERSQRPCKDIVRQTTRLAKGAVVG